MSINAVSDFTVQNEGSIVLLHPHTDAARSWIDENIGEDNGYCESFNGKLRDECLNGEIFYSLKEAQVVIENWRVMYNTLRPHSALGYRPPAPAARNSLAPPNPISQPMAVM